MSFDKVISLPFRNGGIVKLLIGGILEFIPIIFFFPIGYLMECYANGANNREEMPEWTDWGNKFTNGLQVAIIGFVYLFVPIIIFFVAGGFSAIFSSRRGLNFGFGTFLAFLSFIVFFFILQMAISNFAAKKSFGAAFDLGYIFKLIGASFGSYIGAYFLYLVAFVVTMLFSMIPIIGWIFGIFASFYLGCVAAFLFGSVYGKAVGMVNGGVSYAGGMTDSYRETAVTTQDTFCGNCGNRLSPNERFCGNCGNQVR